MPFKGYCALRLDANKLKKVLSTTRSEAFDSLSLWKIPALVIMHWAKYQYMHPIIWLLSHFWLRGFFWRWPYPVAALSRLLSQPTCFKSNGGNVCHRWPYPEQQNTSLFYRDQSIYGKWKNCSRHKGSRGWKLYQSNFIFISSSTSSTLKPWSLRPRDSLHLSSMVTSSHYSLATMCWSVESLCST